MGVIGGKSKKKKKMRRLTTTDKIKNDIITSKKLMAIKHGAQEPTIETVFFLFFPKEWICQSGTSAYPTERSHKRVDMNSNIYIPYYASSKWHKRTMKREKKIHIQINVKSVTTISFNRWNSDQNKTCFPQNATH